MLLEDNRSEVCLSSVAEAVKKVMSVETPFRINDSSENYLSVHTAAIAAFSASSSPGFHASTGAFQAKSQLHSPVTDKSTNDGDQQETRSEPRTPHTEPRTPHSEPRTPHSEPRTPHSEPRTPRSEPRTPPPRKYRRSESKDSPDTPSGGEHCGKYLPSSINSDCYTSDSSSAATTPMKWEPSSPPGVSHPYAALIPFNFPALDEHNKEPIYSQKKDQNGVDLYFCHLCSYTGTSRELFGAHMSTHFEHRCPHCDYTSRTEGRLKRHIKDFHSTTPPDNYSGNKTPRTMPGRPKVYRCKQCEFVATEKLDFWSHARSHIKEDKLLQCPKCPFVTEYKHHLEYHLRNHFGSKPFKCSKCNYACVNKSMLNSHMKSHTNVYQYRCSDCTYATKYCHSLKLHLRKYNHKPATVLNADGSLPQGLDAEAAGLSLLMKRGPPRGPRGPRKDKLEAYLGQLMSLPHLGPRPGLNGLMAPYWPLMGQFPNGFHQPPPLISVSTPTGTFPAQHLPHHKFPEMMQAQVPPMSLKCTFCPFSGENRDDLNGHMLKVHAAENQDLFSMFGITSEALLEEQQHRAAMEAEQSLNCPADFSQKALVVARPPSHPSRSLSTTESLHIRTDTSQEATKSSPRSWPPSSMESNEKETINSCKSMPELFYLNHNNNDQKARDSSSPKADSSDILRQMTLKFGSGLPPAVKENREIPLDLTKPKMMAAARFFCAGKRTMADIESSPPSDTAARDSSAVLENVSRSDVSSPSPRKRSRKGKAYKLDTISWKLQGISSNAGAPLQEDAYSNNSDLEGDLDETSNHSSERGLSHLRDMSPRNRADLNMSGHSDDKEYTHFGDFKDGSHEEHDGSYLSERVIKNDMAKGCEQNQSSGNRHTIEQSSPGGDFEQIHQNLKILNEGEMEKKEGLHGEDRCPSPVSDIRRCSQGSSVGPPPMPVIGNGSHLLPRELHSPIEKNIPGVPRRPGASTAAVRRGAEIAWKILNPDQMASTLSASYQNGYSPVRNYQASDHSPLVSKSKSHLPLMPMAQKLASKVNGMNGIVGSSANHGILHGKKGARAVEKYECSYCDIAFRDCVMYTMHMGYHDYQEPFKCNMCGNQSRDKVEFFLHIARTAHA